MVFAVALLTAAEMAEADRRTIAAGTCSEALMRRAGEAVAAEAGRFGGPVVVFAGPGNNGGDGYVAARVLAAAGRDVTVVALHEPGAPRGDAAAAARLWTGTVVRPQEAKLPDAGVIVDAIFGAGLRGPVWGGAADAIAAMGGSGLPVVAVDVPSGMSGDTGEVLGRAPRATVTVTFARLKPGHVLLPGRTQCGRIVLADIGIADDTIARIGPKTFLNRPELWRSALGRPAIDGHKFSRGHVLVLAGGLEGCGAARLAARGALRAGAGLVTLGSPGEALLAHAAFLEAVMLRRADGPDGLERLLADARRNCVVMGPALGIGEETRAKVSQVLRSGRAAVLDADALTSFSADPAGLSELTQAASRPVVLTPHEGEFGRLFGALAGGKLDRARAAALRSGATVVLKGPDTVVAAPDGRAAIADNAPPDLATAGAGDVLAGMIGGLLAQGMAGFEAAAAGVWMHGEAARLFGPGLISEDLPETLPRVLAALREQASPSSP